MGMGHGNVDKAVLCSALQCFAVLCSTLVDIELDQKRLKLEDRDSILDGLL